MLRTLGEVFRLRRVFGTNFLVAVAAPYSGGTVLAACLCSAGVTLYIFRRYTLSVWIALEAAVILRMYKIAVIGWRWRLALTPESNSGQTESNGTSRPRRNADRRTKTSLFRLPRLPGLEDYFRRIARNPGAIRKLWSLEVHDCFVDGKLSPMNNRLLLSLWLPGLSLVQHRLLVAQHS